MNIISILRTNQNHAVMAAFWMSGTLVSFMAMAIGGRELAAQLSTFQILFFRSIIGCLIVGFFLGCSNWRQILTKQLRVHVLRNISHFGGQFGWFYGIAFIPLAEVFALEFTVPVWTAVLATVLLREKINRSADRRHYFWCAGGVSDSAPGPGGYQSRCAGCSRQRFMLCPVTHPDKKACPRRYPADHPFLYDRHSTAFGLCDLDL